MEDSLLLHKAQQGRHYRCWKCQLKPTPTSIFLPPQDEKKKPTPLNNYMCRHYRKIDNNTIGVGSFKESAPINPGILGLPYLAQRERESYPFHLPSPLSLSLSPVSPPSPPCLFARSSCLPSNLLSGDAPLSPVPLSPPSQPLWAAPPAVSKCELFERGTVRYPFVSLARGSG